MNHKCSRCRSRINIWFRYLRLLREKIQVARLTDCVNTILLFVMLPLYIYRVVLLQHQPYGRPMSLSTCETNEGELKKKRNGKWRWTSCAVCYEQFTRSLIHTRTWTTNVYKRNLSSSIDMFSLFIAEHTGDSRHEFCASKWCCQSLIVMLMYVRTRSACALVHCTVLYYMCGTYASMWKFVQGVNVDEKGI